MLRAILFDMGGTLDGDGLHWLDRFVDVYAACGIALTRDQIRTGFDAAERRAAADDVIAGAGLDAMVRRHLAWQFEAHGIANEAWIDRMTHLFTTPIREVAHRNARVLSGLQAWGYRLGVVSNGCGNVQRLCDDLAYSSYLDVVVDSRLAGVAKPDPAIFRRALSVLAVEASSTLMVGDSYERDILPAHGLGLRTAWLTTAAAPGDRSAADVTIQSLDMLPAHVQPRERTPA